MSRDDSSSAVKPDSGFLVDSLEQLYRFAGTVGTTLDATSVVDDSLGALLSLVEAHQIIVFLAEKDGSTLRSVGARGFDSALSELNLPVDAVAALGSESVGVDADLKLPKFLHPLNGYLSSPTAIVPLWVHGRPLGAVFLNRRDVSFNNTELRLLDVAGRQLALAVENALFFDDVQQSYRRLMDAQEELIRTERLAALGQLSATMAHEIRNPLATIFSALSQVRKHGQVKGDAATLLDIAEEEAMRLNSMVGGLLEFARPRAPRFQDVRPAEIIRNVLTEQSADGALPENVTVNFDPEDPELKARIDVEQFQRAVHHIVGNAIFAAQPKDGHVTIDVSPRADNRGGIVVTVTDDGDGIKPEVIEHVFEPFYSTKPAGTGLGLSVARRIAEDHGGTVEVSSTVGKGTEVRLVLNVGLANIDD